MGVDDFEAIVVEGVDAFPDRTEELKRAAIEKGHQRCRTVLRIQKQGRLGPYGSFLRKQQDKQSLSAFSTGEVNEFSFPLQSLCGCLHLKCICSGEDDHQFSKESLACGRKATVSSTRGTAEPQEIEIFSDFCKKVKAEQTRLFRRLVGGQGKGQCIY